MFVKRIEHSGFILALPKMWSPTRQVSAISNHIRMQNNARAVNHVTHLLKDSFYCIKPVENASCMIAVTKDHNRYLPLNIRFSSPHRTVTGLCRFHYEVKYRKQCIQFLIGYLPGSDDPLLWHISLDEFNRIKSNTNYKKRNIAITANSASDFKRRIKDCELIQLVETYYRNKSLLVSYDDVMMKRGEENYLPMQKGREAELFVKSLLENAGYNVTFPDVEQTTSDLVIHMKDGIKLQVQVKYTSYQLKRLKRNFGETPYQVPMCRASSKPFDETDFDVTFVCVQNGLCETIDWIYCIPSSALAQEGILSSAGADGSQQTTGKTFFFVYPEMEVHKHDQARKPYKYISLNKYKLETKCFSDRVHVASSDATFAHAYLYNLLNTARKQVV